MTKDEARAYFIDNNERIISVAKDENIYNYETQQIEDVFMRRTFEANESAIKALEQEQCKDAISREAVLMELDKYLCGVPFDEKGIDIVIKELPSVKPQIICPIHGVYCKDCSAYEKKLNNWMGAEVLDEIRAEIEKKHERAKQMSSVLQMNAYTDCLHIIDKYKAEEDKE